MKNYLIYFLGLFFLLIGLLALTNLVVDPYDHFDFFRLSKNKKISEPSNYRLYKLSELQKSSASIAVLGDSRMANLIFESPDYINMAYGGASLKEINQTIGLLQKKNTIKKLVVGLNYNLFRGGAEVDQVSEAQKLIEKPWLYLLSPFIFKVSFFQVVYHFTGRSLISETPPIDKESFWQQQIQQTAVVHFSKFSFDQKGFELLQSYVSSRAFEDVVFVIPPNHSSILKVVFKLRGKEEWSEWKESLSEITETLDFNYDHPLNEHKSLFKDPYHAGEELKQKIVDEITGHKPLTYGRWLEH